MSIIFIQYSLLICFFRKAGNFTPEMFSVISVTKFEHCHYIRRGDIAQYSKVSLAAVSASDE